MSSVNKDCFTSFILDWMPFICSPCLIAQCWLELMNMDILVLSCSLGRNIQSLTIIFYGCCKFYVDAFTLLRKFSSVCGLLKTLILGGIGGRRRKGDSRWDDWMASPTPWTWVWVNSGSWWWTGRPGVLRFMGLQGVRHDWATELNWTESIFFKSQINVGFCHIYFPYLLRCI